MGLRPTCSMRLGHNSFDLLCGLWLMEDLGFALMSVGPVDELMGVISAVSISASLGLLSEVIDAASGDGSSYSCTCTQAVRCCAATLQPHSGRLASKCISGPEICWILEP